MNLNYKVCELRDASSISTEVVHVDALNHNYHAQVKKGHATPRWICSRYSRIFYPSLYFLERAREFMHHLINVLLVRRARDVQIEFTQM